MDIFDREWHGEIYYMPCFDNCNDYHYVWLLFGVRRCRTLFLKAAL